MNLQHCSTMAWMAIFSCPRRLVSTMMFSFRLSQSSVSKHICTIAISTRFVEGASEACRRNKDNAQWYINRYGARSSVEVHRCSAFHMHSSKSIIQYNTIQHNTIQYNTIQHNTIQHNTTQHNTIQYSACIRNDKTWKIKDGR